MSYTEQAQTLLYALSLNPVFEGIEVENLHQEFSLQEVKQPVNISEKYPDINQRWQHYEIRCLSSLTLKRSRHIQRSGLNTEKDSVMTLQEENPDNNSTSCKHIHTHREAGFCGDIPRYKADHETVIAPKYSDKKCVRFLMHAYDIPKKQDIQQPPENAEALKGRCDHSFLRLLRSEYQRYAGAVLSARLRR